MIPPQRYLLSDLGSFRPVVLECRDCDECGASTSEDELFDGLCPSCQLESGTEATHWARGGSML